MPVIQLGDDVLWVFEMPQDKIPKLLDETRTFIPEQIDIDPEKVFVDGPIMIEFQYPYLEENEFIPYVVHGILSTNIVIVRCPKRSGKQPEWKKSEYPVHVSCMLDPDIGFAHIEPPDGNKMPVELLSDIIAHPEFLSDWLNAQDQEKYVIRPSVNDQEPEPKKITFANPAGFRFIIEKRNLLYEESATLVQCTKVSGVYDYSTSTITLDEARQLRWELSPARSM